MPAILASAASANTCPPGSGPGPYCQRIPTRIVAPALLFGGVTATLYRTDTGAPLQGQTLTFTAGGTTLCVATTNATGTAGCPGLIPLLEALLNLGFHVTYAGNTTYLPSSATGNLIQLGTLIIGPGGITTSFQAHGSITSRQRALLKAELRHIGRKQLLHDLRVLRAQHRI